MGITAKELAKKMGLSPAAVSMALNDRPGVSTKTRKAVKVAAEKYGYDFSKIKTNHVKDGCIHFIVYKKNGAIVDDTPFFAKVSEGISAACAEAGYRLKIQYLYESEFTQKDLDEIQYSDCAGILLLGTEMVTDDLVPFLALPVPLVLLDSYFETFACDTVIINNTQGAYLATRHLIDKCHAQPGYLKSSYAINNFNERQDGFYKAARLHGMSSSQSIVHELTPSMSGAYADMKELLAGNEPLARCYFADNDLIAAGAIKAFREKGLRIPEDVAVVGFDNIPISQILDLTTINVPKEHLGRQAVLRLLQRIKDPSIPPVKIEIGTSLVDRYSC